MLKSALYWNALILVLLLAACGGGNEAGGNGGETGGENGAGGSSEPLALTGDTIYDAELKINIPANLDHSSPTKLVESFLSIRRIENDPDLEKKGKKLEEQMEQLLWKELDRLEQELLTEEAHKAAKKQREEPEERPDLYDSETSDPEIISDEKQEDGSVLVTTKAVRTTRQRESEDAEWKEEKQDVMRRAYLVQEDGKWYIDRMESRRKDWQNSTEEETKYKWEPDNNTPAHFKYRLEKDSPEFLSDAPAIQTGSAKEAADSFMGGLVKLYRNGEMKMLYTMFNYIADEYSPAFSKGAHEKAKEAVKEDRPSNDGYEIEEVIKISDTESEVKVLLNPGSEYKRYGAIRAVKTDDGWRVSETGRYQKNYETNEDEYQKNDDLYRIR